MKKLLLITTLLLISLCVFADESTDSSFKAGIALGYPTGVTAGWRPSDNFELNALLGTNYTGFTIGITPLFTLVEIDIADQQLPLSLGPQVNLNLRGYGLIDLDVLAVLRLEYTLPELPLNFFIEGGLGVNINFYSSVFGEFGGLISPVRFSGSGAVGARYVF